MQNLFPAIDEVGPFLAYAVAVSTFFYIKTKSVLRSVHGILIVFLYLYACVAMRYSEFGSAPKYDIPLLVLLGFSFLSVVFSCTSFKGKGWQNMFLLLHIGTVFCGLFVWFISAMAVSHDWL